MNSATDDMCVYRIKKQSSKDCFFMRFRRAAVFPKVDSPFGAEG